MEIAVQSVGDRAAAARRGRQLEIVTVLWGGCEALVALYAARQVHSISLTGFGLDSVIEVVSASALMWRLSHEMDPHSRHRAEHVSLRIAGMCLITLAAYICFESLWALLHGAKSQTTWLGIGITAAALVLMPLLSRAKKQVGRILDSNAMLTDARQTDFCYYQAAIVLMGLAVRATIAWPGVDSIAALLLVPIILRAGYLSLSGQKCCAH